MNLAVEVGFNVDNSNDTQQIKQFHYALIGNQPITDLLRYMKRGNQQVRCTLYPGVFPPTVSYLCNVFNNF
jgi:hypothetical protein